MDNPLGNPLDGLEDQGQAPDWIWKVGGAVAGVLGGLIARRLLNRIRSRVSGDGDRRMALPYALAWTSLVGVAAALGRLFAQRTVASIWTRRNGRRLAAASR